jgi:hypothetical protein
VWWWKGNEKMKKKMKRFDGGGYTGDDEIVKYRMGMIDAKGNDLTKSKKETSVDTKQETSDDLDPYGAASKKPVAVEKTVVKTKISPSRDFDTTDSSVSEPKKNAVEDLKKIISPSMPKSFKESGGNTTPKKSTTSFPSIKFSLPDPLAQFDAKGKRYSGRDTEDRKKGGAIKKMAMGGSVKVSSASKRADGIAQRGKTKGKMC